jgi:hypothetical protein
MGFLGGAGSLGAVTSGAAELTLSITASSTQAALLSVSESATAAGGVGGFTYAWTLTDPAGTSRTALLSSSTAAAPTWTPDARAGAWVVICTVSSGSQTAKAARVLTLGTSGWVEICDLDFAIENDQNPSGGTLTVANRAQQGSPSETLTLINEANDAGTGPKVLTSRLVISPEALATYGASNTSQLAPGVVVTLSSILTGFAATLLRRSDVIVIVQCDAVTYPQTNDTLAIVLEDATGIGGSGGSGVATHTLAQAGGVRLGGRAQVGSTVTTGVDATSSVATARVFVAQFGGGSQMVSAWSATATDADTFATALALVAPGSVVAQQALSIANNANVATEWMVPSTWRLGLYSGAAASAGAGPVWNIERVRIFVAGT